jgi:hypothetical protein
VPLFIERSSALYRCVPARATAGGLCRSECVVVQKFPSLLPPGSSREFLNQKHTRI